MQATALLPQTNEGESGLEVSARKETGVAPDQETQSEGDQRLSNSSLDLGPLGIIEKHAPAVYEILEDPEWQELDEVGRYRVLVPQLRIEWGLDSDSSKKLVETLNSIDQQVATGKQRRLARNAKRILGSALDTLFTQLSLGLKWISFREGMWKDIDKTNAISVERLNDYLDCIESCKSKLFGCYVQSESDFESDVIEDIETALSDPASNRSSVRKWRSLEPVKGATRLFLSMIDCNQNFLKYNGLECDRIIFYGTTEPAAKVELPEKPTKELKPGSSHDNNVSNSSPGTS